MPTTTLFQASPLRPRLKLLKRADADYLPALKLTPRDMAIIEAVYSFRALTIPQIGTLLFPGSVDFQPNTKNPGSGKTNRCRHRLKLLYHHGFLYRDELPIPLAHGRRPLIYFLDKRGKETLCAHYGLDPKAIDWQPCMNNVGHAFLEHLLKTNDVRVAFTVAARRQNHKVTKWLDDRSLRQQQHRDYVWVSGPQGGKPRRVAIVPDGYVQLQVDNDDFHFLLEADRRTVVGQYTRWGGKDWTRKVRAYIAYFSPPAPGQLSLYAQRFGTPHLRVLTVTTGPTRLANLKRITEQAGGRKRFWFTTFEQVSAETILHKPIWQKAVVSGQFSLVG